MPAMAASDAALNDYPTNARADYVLGLHGGERADARGARALLLLDRL